MILCAGESLIDMVPQDGHFTPLPGGAVMNTAIALARLGAPTAYLWPISRDPFGEALLRSLAEAGVNTDFCPRSDRLTTLAFVSLIGGEARYSFYDEGSAGRMLAARDLPQRLDGVQALFAGGISLVPDPCGAAVEALLTREAANLPVMLDPNIRPFFVQDEPAYRARLDRLFALADVVKLSTDDLDWLFPDLSPEAAAAKVLARGPQIVLLTGGDKGATAIWSHDPVSAPAFQVEVADTIGAGDTFNAGFLTSLHRDGLLTKAALATLPPEALLRALMLGAKAASVTVSRAGANPPWAHEITLDESGTNSP
ncbi:MAG: carbohydrate kinase [Paracoccus sp. (in: a-proteobacteria)]|uniref:carbohydrate kinase family protein n=1 Tax=Paracoccus sp. TaxID=267 RepID=UPI0026DF7BF8|nr:carbohydrate kinase [Paracoccus sp. (in: a-proteobacteria)]MDO5621091.1 carbohydrate kinase [Paracoccus sp. (in: a-proteobacteria)]